MGASFTFQTIDRRGHEFFRQIRIRKSADLIPDEDIFLIIAVNSFMVQYRKQCVFGKGGMLFSHPDGGIMQFYHLVGGGVNIFFLTPRRCLPPPPPPLKFMNSPLA